MTAPTAESAAQSQADLLSVDADFLWHPWSPSRVSAETTVVVAGDGCEVQDVDGRRFLDAKSSGLNATLGYGCRPVIDAISAQLRQLMTYDMGEGSNVPAIRLAERIAGLTGPHLTRTFFCNSGSEALETGIRIARFYQAVLGFPERTVVVSLDNAYHGSTMAAAACSATSSPVADDVAPSGFVTVRRPGRAGAESIEGPEGIEDLREFLSANGTRTAAVLVEPVQGRGGYVMPDACLREIREMCDQQGILLILDEVMTGFGRTGRMFAYEHAGVQPDILATSKGLSAGYMSLAAVTTTTRVFDVFDRNKDKAGFVHGHTHSGHAAACAAGLAVIDFIETQGVLSNVRARGEQLLDALEPVRSMPGVRDLRGRGLLVAVELDRARRAARVKDHMRGSGILVRRTGRSIVLAPPLIITASQTDRIAQALVAAASAAASEAP
ncbi:aminotransferase family protein [Streptomyces cahuitamycinicus]|uniref:Aspartate aminotransferase family protein n=1 Tax=Streptomyces cahuitamycinicus TaxID=2070367 RepID=A0A2N8TXW7_9ACTN|nr:aminotransferase class III-fold pyridoxal phosphate-dependent enzyme [Streptomyces cahuitamycinicus]PNG23851.1 aspartate aminotransferase family protein [Streptomyces cahuitamycinicus]